MKHLIAIAFFCLSFLFCIGQTNVYRDTLSVYENNIKLLSPWAGGLNFTGFSQIDLNADGKNDIVAYDKICSSGGRLRTYLNIGSNGVARYKHSPEYQSQFPSVTEWVMCYDYNNDNKADLFTYTTGGIKVYKNTSVGAVLSFSLVSNLLLSDYNPSGTPNVANIYSNPVGMPGFADVDRDGDMDILTYSVFGIKMEYHKNQSMEQFGDAEHLVFDMVDDCWGDMQESNCEVYLNQCPLKVAFDSLNPQKTLHAGSCIMCMDNDGDNDVDLLLGDISCTRMEYVENVGSTSNAHIGDTTKLFPNYPNKASTTVIKMNSFPCSYNLDVDNDGIKDLIASPNAIAGAENIQSVWYYKNATSTPTANFVIQKKNFLQEDMIELGEGAYPVLFDADADGKKDLIVGHLGAYYNGVNQTKLAYYKNVGTSTVPSFSLITKDYQALSTYSLYSMAPTFGDLDNDGDQDLLVGSSNGRIHYFENTAGAGNPALFGNYIANYQNISGSSFVYPQLFDVNKNGLLDLVIGSINGKLAYWDNKGTATSPLFSLTTSSLGGVSVKQSGYATGYSTPFMYNDAGVTKLLVGSEIGNIYLYDNIDNNLAGVFNKVDTTLFKINEGPRCAPFFEDITNDGKRDLFIGNHAGGLAFFNSTNVYGVGIEEQTLTEILKVYPNPCTDKLTVAIDDDKLQKHQIKIIDVLGKELYSVESYNKTIEIPTTSFSKGIYFLEISADGTKNKVVERFLVW